MEPKVNYSDTLTMARRCFLLSWRNPDTLLTSIVMPVMMMLLFVTLFGSLIQIDGISYVNYIVPGVLLQCLGQCSCVTAIAMNRDISTGIVSRFCTLPIRKSSILTGRIAEGLVRNGLTAIVVLLAAMPLGFCPAATPAGLAVTAVLLLGVILTYSWLALIVGLLARTPEGTSGIFTFAIVLPYISSGFVPTEAMPKALALFAKYQPMTPIIDTMRNALLGKTLDFPTLFTALGWCAAGILLFTVLALILFRRRMHSSMR